MEHSISKNPKVIGFDMDGVIIDHTRNKLALAESYALRLHPPETHSEIISRKFAHEEYRAFENELYGDSDFALSAPLMPGALPVLEELQRRSIPFVLISRRGDPKTPTTLLVRRGLWGNVFTPENTFFVHSIEEKNMVSKEQGVTHFFDDERHVLRALASVPHRHLFDSFRQFEDESEFDRVYDWDMIRELLLAD